MKNKFVVLVALLACAVVAAAQAAEPVAAKKWMAGTELDLVPFANGGYYTSAVLGYGRLRARCVLTGITTPAFYTQPGFRDNTMHVNAYIVDYYFRDGFKGWWVGPGYETWDGSVKEKSSGLKRSYRTSIVTLGGGYTFRIGDHFYINPWAALHFPVGGDRNVDFVSKTYRLRAVPEASAKLGFNF